MLIDYYYCFHNMARLFAMLVGHALLFRHAAINAQSPSYRQPFISLPILLLFRSLLLDYAAATPLRYGATMLLLLR